MRSLLVPGQHSFVPTQRSSNIAQFPETLSFASPSTSETTWRPSCEHSLCLFSLCCLPLEILYKICIYLNVVGLLRLEITSKTMLNRIRACGIYRDHSRYSRYPLVRHLHEYIYNYPSEIMTPTPRVSHIYLYPMILDFNLELMIVQLERDLEEGCQQIKRDIQNIIENREEAGYTKCAQLSYIKAQELIFLELLSARILSLKVNNLFPTPAMTVGPQGNIMSALAYPSLVCQNRGNIKKILRNIRNRSFTSAGAQLRSNLFPVTSSVSRCYGAIHHSARTEMILNLVCRPFHVVNTDAPLCLPNGDEIYPASGPPMLAPVLIHPGGIIVNADSDNEPEWEDDFDWFIHNAPDHMFEGFAWGGGGQQQLDQQQY